MPLPNSISYLKPIGPFPNIPCNTDQQFNLRSYSPGFTIFEWYIGNGQVEVGTGCTIEVNEGDTINLLTGEITKKEDLLTKKNKEMDTPLSKSMSKKLIVNQLKTLAGDRFPTLEPSANKNKSQVYELMKSYLYRFFDYDFINSLDLKENYSMVREYDIDICLPSLAFHDKELPFTLHFRLPYPPSELGIHFYIGRGHYKHWQEKAYLIYKGQEKSPETQLLESMADYLSICHR